MQGEHLQTVVFPPTEGGKGGLFSRLCWKKSTHGFENLNLDHYLMLQIKENDLLPWGKNLKIKVNEALKALLFSTSVEVALAFPVRLASSSSPWASRSFLLWPRVVGCVSQGGLWAALALSPCSVAA